MKPENLLRPIARFTENMRRLDEAEQLLASCSIRGVVRDHRSHMEINRLIIDAARRQLEEVEASRTPQPIPTAA